MQNEAVLAQYRSSQIQTASVDRLVLMLYEGALKAARDCQTAMSAGDLALTSQSGRQVQDILVGLVDILNRDHQDAGTLRDLYLYCWRQAVSCQRLKDPKELDGAIVVLQNLADGLRQFLSIAANPPSPTADTAGSVASTPGSSSINLAG